MIEMFNYYHWCVFKVRNCAIPCFYLLFPNLEGNYHITVPLITVLAIVDVVGYWMGE